MNMKKIFFVICAIIPLGMFAQEIRYVTVPASQNVTTPATVYQTQSQTLAQSFVRSNEFSRDTLKTSQKKAIHTTFIKNKPQDNWFLSLYGGAAMLQSEESRYRNFEDQLNLTGGFALGKWHSPVWGLRLSASMAKLQGFAVNCNEGVVGQPYYFMGSWLTGANFTNGEGASGIQNSYTSGTTPDGANLIANRYLNLDDRIVTPKGTGYSYDATYFGASIDVLLNLKNYFSRYNPKAVFNPVLYAGLGYARTFGDDSKEWIAVDNIMGKGGLQLNFRLGNNCDFFIDGQALVLPEFFDRRVGDNLLVDVVLNGLAGFTFKFNEANFYEPCYVIPQQIAYVDKPQQNYGDDITERLNKIEELLLNPPRTGRVDPENLRVIVYFIIDKWEVRQSEMYKLDEIAKFMNKYQNVRVSIEGYADIQTAYPAYNMKLSKRRADEVARILTTKYGIDSRRLRVQHFGDTVQPFNVNELNRAVIAFDIPED